MAGRRSLRSQQPEEEPQGRRRSLRLARQKAAPFNYQRSLAYQAPTNSAQMDFATPRTVFKKVLQTQPIVSPLVSEKPDSPKPIDTIFNFPVKLGSSIWHPLHEKIAGRCIKMQFNLYEPYIQAAKLKSNHTFMHNLEVSLSDSTQRQKSKLARHPTRSKKVRVSEFERDLNNQLHFSTARGLLDHTSLTNSLQISFTTPAPLNSAGRKGLIRRPKNYQGVNVKDFEGGLEQDLLQIKDSENNPEDQKTTTLQSNNTEALSVETELFLPPHSSEENETEPSNVLPGPDLARKPFGRRSAPSLSQTRLARQDEISDMEVEKVAESSPPKTLTSGREFTTEPETESMEKDEGYQEKCQEKPQDAGKGLRPSLGKENLSPGPEDAGSIESISQKRIDTPQKQQRKHFQGNSPDEELFTPTEPLKTGLGARSSSPRIDAQLPGASQRNFSTWLSRKIVRRSVNEMVAHITKELDSIVPAVAGPSMAKVDSEEESSLREITFDITQSPKVATPYRRASGKTPKQQVRSPFKETRDRTNPQTGDKNRTKEMRNVETEQILEFEAKDNPEVEEMIESEDVATEISQSPRVATPGRRASGKTPKTLERFPFKEMRDRTNPQTGDKNRRKQMRNVETEQILEFEAKDNPEVEMSESEDVATEISQSPRVATPGRRASGKTPKTLEWTTFKATRDRTNPQTGDKNRRKQMNVETEKILEFEAKDNPDVEMSESEDVAIEISQSPRVATVSRRASGKTPKMLEGTPFKATRDRTNPQTGDRNRTKEMRNVETEQILEFEAEDNPEVEEMSEFKDVAIEISQSPRVATPGRRASGKTPKTLERFPFKEMRDRTNPQTGDKNRRKQMRNVETEQILEFEAKDNPEVKEMSESVDIATEISQSPRVATPSRRTSGKTPKTLERTSFKATREGTNPQTGDKNRIKKMRNVETEQILEFEAEDNPEVEEMSESVDVATEISQSPRVATSGRRASGKTPKTLEGTPFKATRDRTNPQTSDKNRRKQMRNVETEQILEFEAKDNPEVEMSESVDVAIEISQSPRVSTPSRRASGKIPKTLEGTPFKATREGTNPQTGDRNRRKQMRNVETEKILEFEAKDNPEVEEMSESEDVAIEISRPRVATPSRRASGKTPKTLEGTPFKATRQRTNPQTGDRNRTKEMRNVETEQILEFEAEDNPEVEEMSEAEDVEPTGSTPAFVRAKAFHCTPLLSSPRVLKEVASGSPVKQNLVQRVPKPAKKARREKREPSLPSNLVKKMFTHYVKMPVTKEALQVVDRCVNVYFKHLSNDLEAYANHARRKTAEAADLELLMRRQGLITDKTPLNVLVERHLPLEYRKLLIPIAISGNKVIPQKLK